MDLKLDFSEECFMSVRRRRFFLGGSFLVGSWDRVSFFWGY